MSRRNTIDHQILKSANTSNLVVGLDVGTTKICAIIGRVKHSELEILTVGSAESKGLKKGIVVDVGEATTSISKALKDAEDNGKVKIDSVYVGIAGGHIKSFNGYGVIGIRERRVTETDVERLIEMASAVYVPVDREVLHIIPTGFSIDGINGIVDPLGKKGAMLEARVHIVTGAITAVQSLISCCEAAGVKVADIVFEPIASAEAVLSKEEKEMGTLMIDLGGGTTDVAIFIGGILRHTASFPIGGNHITHDIAIGLGITMEEAEQIKLKIEDWRLNDLNHQINKSPDQHLTTIVYLRCEELFSLIKKEIIVFSGYKSREDLPPYIKSVVLTGGTSLLKGIDLVAEKILGRPTRIGIPEGVTDNSLKNPIYSTGVGLVRLGDWGCFGNLKVVDRMKEWVTGLN